MMHRGWSLGITVLVLSLAASITAPRVAHAADSPSALHAGAWAVELDKDMGSSSFTQNEVSIKHMTSATSAFRLSLGISYSGGGGTGTEVTIPPTTPLALGQSYFSRYYTLRLDWVRHFATSQNFDATFGVGPVAAYSGYSSSNTDASPYNSSNWSRTRQFGGEVNLGAEWFFTNRFSLGGRTGIVALLGKQKQRYRFVSGGNGYTQEFELDANRIVTDPARIILTAYL